MSCHGIRRLLLSAGVLLTNVISTHAQLVEWAKAVGSPGANFGFGLAVDDGQSVITTGWFSGTVDFDPGAGVANRSSNGGEDIYVLKLDGNGQFLWVLTFGGSGSDRGYDIVTDNAANIYVSGNFSSTVDFQPGPGIDTRTAVGNWDAFFLKIDFLGNYQWVRSWGGNGDDYGYALTHDINGFVVVTGMFSSTVDFDTSPASLLKSSAGSFDIFVSKFTDEGVFVWNRTMGGSAADFSYSVQCDDAGNIFHGGYFSGSVDFDPGPGQVILNVQGSNDVYVQKMTSTGQHIWTRGVQGVGNEFLHNIRYNGLDQLYITGNFSGTLDFNPGPAQNLHTSNGSFDAYILTLDTNGLYLWSRTFGGDGNDLAVTASPDRQGNINVAGLFTGGNVDMDPGPGVRLRSSNGGYDVFVSKFSANGQLLWNIAFGGTGNDEAWGIAADYAGNVHTTGPFSTTVDFDPGPITLSYSSLGQTDIFVHKIRCGSVHAISLTGCGSVVDPFSGLVYTKSDTLIDTTTNQWECDSVVIRYITVNPLPVNPIVNGNFTPSAQSLQQYVLANYNAAWQYNWQVVGGVLAAATGPNVFVNWGSGGQTGYLILRSQRDSSCFRTDTLAVAIGQAASIHNKTLSSGTVYPSPSTGYFYFDLNDEDLSFRLLDITGRSLLIGTAHEGDRWRIDVPHLPPGNYVLEARRGVEVVRKKIQIMVP